MTRMNQFWSIEGTYEKDVPKEKNVRLTLIHLRCNFDPLNDMVGWLFCVDFEHPVRKAIMEIESFWHNIKYQTILDCVIQIFSSQLLAVDDNKAVDGIYQR